MGHLPLQSEGLINWFRSLFNYTPPAAHDEVTAEIVQLCLGLMASQESAQNDLASPAGFLGAVGGRSWLPVLAGGQVC